MTEKVSSENTVEEKTAESSSPAAENSAPESEGAAAAKITVSDALKKIEEAEERAREIRENAKEKAREINKSAAEECEAVSKEYADLTKREIGAIMAEANSKADKYEADTKKAVEQSLRDSIKSAEKNVRSAGDWIFEQLIKGKY